METMSRESRVALPWELLYGDDLVVIAETEEDLIKMLNKWKNNVENRDMRVNMNKMRQTFLTVYLTARVCGAFAVLCDVYYPNVPY